MLRSLWISVIVHMVFITLLLLGAGVVDSDEPIKETLNIRLRTPVGTTGSAQIVRGGSPDQSIRDTQRTVPVPSSGTTYSEIVGDGQIPRPSAVISRSRIGDGPAAPAVTAPPQSRFTDTLDPLAGMEKVLPDGPAERVSETNPWSLSWVNGGKRGIISFPMIDINAFPEDTERLLNVQLILRVSPEGEVVTAEIIPPGSGDIRIDRYMHSIALQLFLEPWPVGEGVQEGRLRLLFVGGRQ